MTEVASPLPGFLGAFFHGSIIDMRDDEVFPAGSDVDIGVVLAGSEGGGQLPKLGKTRREGVLIEGAVFSRDRVAAAEQVLADYRLAPSFQRDGILADPTGHLKQLQQAIGRHFAEPAWVKRRCEAAAENGAAYLRALDAPLPYYTRATCWLFAEGSLAHVALVAGLRNPTIRRRYCATRELLTSVGRPDVHATLLAMLGCGGFSPERVDRHLERMAEAFDAAASVVRPDYRFASDLSAAARPVAVGGSRELCRNGEPREAVFWIAVTYARCMDVLEGHGPDLADAFRPGFQELMSELGAGTLEDTQRKGAEIEAFRPDLLALVPEFALIASRATQDSVLGSRLAPQAKP